MKYLLACLFFVSHILSATNVSIITPIYKSEEFIEGFLEDITKQTIFDQCELILVTGNSPQNEIKYIRPYLETYPNIRLIPLKYNTTMYQALNVGIEMSVGKYLYFAAVDNRIKQNTLELFEKTLDQNPRIDCVYADTIVTESPNETFEKNTHEWSINLPEFDPSDLTVFYTGPQPMWRKSLHTKFGYFKDRFEVYGNWEFWNRLATGGARFKHLPNPQTLVYSNPNGLTTSFDTKISKKREEEYNWILQTYGGYTELSLISTQPLSEKPFVLVIPSYNNKDWYRRNLDSVCFQNYSNYRIIYIDDASPDGTGDLVEAYLHERGLTSKVTLIKNQIRVGALANLYTGIHLCGPDEIVATVDGDDWLLNNEILNRLNEEYSDPDCWMTYGQYAHFLGDHQPLYEGHSAPIPEYVTETNTIRSFPKWLTSQLRTFYAGLFHKIHREDLLWEGDFFPMTYDVAIMMPMLEMAGFHVRFIPDILYVYNRVTPTNDDKLNRLLQLNLDLTIRDMPPYEPITDLN